MNRTCSCDNCDWKGAEEQTRTLVQIHRLGERIEAGGVVPVGECPECGAFAYLDEPPAQYYYVLHSSGDGMELEEFLNEENREAWLKKQDDAFADFYCINAAGRLVSAYTAECGEDLITFLESGK